MRKTPYPSFSFVLYCYIHKFICRVYKDILAYVSVSVNVFLHNPTPDE